MASHWREAQVSNCKCVRIGLPRDPPPWEGCHFGSGRLRRLAPQAQRSRYWPISARALAALQGRKRNAADTGPRTDGLRNVWFFVYLFIVFFYVVSLFTLILVVFMPRDHFFWNQGVKLFFEKTIFVKIQHFVFVLFVFSSFTSILIYVGQYH